MTDKNSFDDLKGLGYIHWVRCSTKAQVDTSVPDQLHVENGFGILHGMKHVDDMILEGISGASPKVYEKIKELIARKKAKDDFDVLLVHDLSRLTRGGPNDGGRIIADLRDAGIRLISVKDNIPNDKLGAVYQMLKHYTDQQQSEAIALATTRGSMSALSAGKRPHTQTTNYGLDRRIIGPDGEQRYRLRLNEDGSQDKLTLDGKTVLETFAPNPKSGSPNHYKLQKNEDYDFVLGKPERIEVVNRMYRRHHLDNWSGYRIAKELNDEGIPSPKGGLWTPETIHRILMNPIYLGVGLANFESTGRYYMRSDDGATPTNRSPEEMANYTQMPRRIRPEKDWKHIEQPLLDDFLDPRVRQPAMVEQAAYYERKAKGIKKKPGSYKNRSAKPQHILSYRMFETTTGLPMVGHTSKRGDKQWFSYKTKGAYRKPSSNPEVPTGMIPAPPVNQMVVGLLGEVIRMAPDLRDVLRRQIIAQQERNHAGRERMEGLTKQADEVRRQIVWIMENVCKIGEDEAGKKLAGLAEQRDRLDLQIKMIKDCSVLSDAEINALVEKLVDQIGKTQDLVRKDGMPAIHHLLDLLLVKAEADVERKWVDFEFRLPPWALTDPEALCLSSGHVCMTWRGACAGMVEDGLLLMRFKAFPYGKGRWLAFGYAE